MKYMAYTIPIVQENVYVRLPYQQMRVRIAPETSCNRFSKIYYDAAAELQQLPRE